MHILQDLDRDTELQIEGKDFEGMRGAVLWCRECTELDGSVLVYFSAIE